MEKIFQKIIAFLLAIASFVSGLFGISGDSTDPAPESETVIEQVTEAATVETEESAPIASEPSKELLRRDLPPLKSREEMLNIIQQEEYGYLPSLPETLSFSVAEEDILPEVCKGKAVVNKVIASGTLNGNPFSFPFYTTIPSDGKQHPFFIHINFRDQIPDKYMPTEKLVNLGFAVLSVCYLDVTSDDGDFTNGLAGAVFPDGERSSSDPGKIALWAWAAQRIMDYAETLPDVLDPSLAIVCGHSRLGKTALLAAATDERFSYAYSNDAGCSGDAVSRGASGETIADICRRFPFWFCKNYLKYAENEEGMPFDQHYLIACIAPRRVLLGSASEDAWADPISQQLGALAASPAFRVGLIAPDQFAETGQAFLQGDIGFHKRAGEHFFKPADWARFFEFIKLHE